MSYLRVVFAIDALDPDDHPSEMVVGEIVTGTGYARNPASPSFDPDQFTIASLEVAGGKIDGRIVSVEWVDGPE